jgi:hypothetical protein
MNHDDLLPIAAACGEYVGIKQQAECALRALALIDITGSDATRIAATAAADMADAETHRIREFWRSAQDFVPQDDARRLANREAVSRRLRTIAAGRPLTLQVAA